MSGMLARWQGLRMMLRMPHMTDAVSAISGAPSTAWLRLVKSCSMSHFNSTPSSFHLARMSSLAKKPMWRKSSLPLASKKICVGIISTP